MKKGYILLLFVLFNCFCAKAQLVVNEFSQGPATLNAEWFEFVVVGTRTCSDSTADLRGWIFDDDDAALLGSGAGQASGCLRFANDPNWAAVPYGSIILVYSNNEKDPQITVADDPTDANHDHVYVTSVGSPLFETHSTDITSLPYPSTGFTSGGSWNTIIQANGGDAVVTISPSNLNTYYDAVTYGSASGGNVHLAVSGSGSTNSFYVNGSQWDQTAGWLRGTNTTATPGMPNTAANATWINSMLSSSSAALNTALNINICQGQSFTFNGTAYNTTGTHVATYQTAGGCDSIVTLNLTVNPVPAKPLTLSNSPVCVGNPLTLSATSTTAGVTYSWTGPNSFTSTLQNPLIASATAQQSGTYSVTANINGCISTPVTLAVVVNPTPIIANATGQDPTSCSVGNGKITLTGLTNGVVYTVHYTKDGVVQPAVAITASNTGTVIIIGLAAGTYTAINVTSTGCVSNDAGPVVLANPAPPAAPVAGSDAPVCENGTLHLTATTIAGATYKWTGPNSFTSTVQNPVITNVPLLAAGTYTVTATVNGCIGAGGNTTVTINPLPATPTASSNSPVCFNSTINLSASSTTANVTYSWTGPNSFTASIQNPTITNATAANNGGYSAYATSVATGCRSKAGTTNVIVNTAPPMPVITTNSPVCFGTTLTLSATGAGTNTYLWTGPNGFSAVTQQVSIVNATGVNAGVYSVVASIGSCTSAVASITVTVNPLPSAPIAQNVTYCQDDIAAALIATGTNLQWYTSPAGGTATGVAPVPNTSVPGVFNFYVSQVINGCESGRVPVVVTIKQKPTPPAVSATITYCQFEPAVALTATGQDVQWYTTATGGSSSSTAPVPVTNIANTYLYYATQTINGCESDRGVISVIVYAKPPAPQVKDTGFCMSSVANPLTAVGQNLLWYKDTTLPGSPYAPIPVTTHANDTTIWYVSQRINGCEGPKAAMKVTIYPIPEATITTSNHPYICQHDTMTFSYSGPLAQGNTYAWQLPFGVSLVNGSLDGSSLTARFDSSGTANVLFTINNGHCSASAAYTVVINRLPYAALGLPQDACPDKVVNASVYYLDNVKSYTLNLGNANVISSDSTYGNYHLSWSKTGLQFVKLTLTAANNCPSLTIIDTINIHPTPDAKISVATAGTICTGDTVLFSVPNPDTAYTYKWTPQQFFRSGNASELYGRIDVSGYVYLDVTSDFGCSASDSIQLETQPCCEVYFPNAFTPNNDGKNDIFRSITVGHHTLKELRVINRWGQTIFQTNEERIGWDGTFDGVPQPMGTYYYYIKYKCSSGKEFEEKGDFTLIR